MHAFTAWVMLAAVITWVACLADDPRALVTMFIISVLMPEELFVEEL